MKKNYKVLCEELLSENADMIKLIDTLMKTNNPGQAGHTCKRAPEPTIQPDSNIGEPGDIQNVQSINIAQEEDGSVKIKSDAMCVKLHEPVVAALKRFFEIADNVQNDSEE
ncbi:MAG: hypothetical protein JSW62_03085 [Thermoplasmatales archaeon]|nr:MAG: hypothetical protein JSW62_03085 [Thermoplasmatales archaeon]